MCAPFSPRKYKSILRGFIIWFPSGRLPRVINCAFDQSFHAKSENACLLLVYSFSPRVHSIPRGPLISARNDKKCVARMAKTTLKSCAFFGDDVFTAQVNFVIYFTIFLRLSLVIKINRFLLRVKIGGKSPLFFGNAVRISPF